LGLEKHILMSYGDKKQEAFERDSVQEDLFEAILGAVALDSDWDISALSAVVECMLNPEFYFKNGLDKERDYATPLGEWYQARYGAEPQYQITKQSDEHFYCTLKALGYPVFKAEAQNADGARRECAKQAALYLMEIGEMDAKTPSSD
jgi:ribonuclease-3